ncbi:MAG TPA: universal stress protein [Mycobacteriales bacterium]|jgi:nucleotide-binding universal stress UspA family protein|nr:universal stress protein [Mycobacteriales bacterium]
MTAQQDDGHRTAEPTGSGDAAGAVVVGMDGSASAAAALRWAAQQARSTGRPLQVLHCFQLKASQAEAAGEAFCAVATADARARATRWVLDAVGPAVAVPWTLVVVEGPPGPTLAERSHDAALLVVGTGEHTGIRRLAPGSVSHHVLSRAVPPVVAVHAPARTGVA